jgi:hypothetical protein
MRVGLVNYSGGRLWQMYIYIKMAHMKKFWMLLKD